MCGVGYSFIWSVKKMASEAGGTAQLLRALNVLPEELAKFHRPMW